MSLLAMGFSAVFIFIVSQYWTSILDIVLPMNESRPFRMLIVTQYFIDQQKYFFLIMLHITIAYCIGTATVIATGTMLITCVQHFCGMFRIARYEIHNIETAINIQNTKIVCYAINK